MSSRAKDGPELAWYELEELEFDVRDILFGQMCDTVFRVARAAGIVGGHNMMAGSQEFADSGPFDLRLLYAFDGKRLVIALQPEDEDCSRPFELLRPWHERAG